MSIRSLSSLAIDQKFTFCHYLNNVLIFHKDNLVS